MKWCGNCETDHPVDQFGVNRSTSDGLQSSCRSSRRAYQRDWYSRNRDVQGERVRRNAARILDINRQYVVEWFKAHPCVDCGESDIVVLEFDHVRGTKSFAISEGMNRHPLERIKSEIEKCDSRCANCHRRKTADQLGWWTSNMAP